MNRNVDTNQRGKRQSQEGMAMLVVMMVLLGATASATFGIHSTMFEMRAAGHARQVVQTQYISEAGLMSTLAYFSVAGAGMVKRAMDNTGLANKPVMAEFGEPELLPGNNGYRFMLSDFSADGFAQFTGAAIDMTSGQESYGSSSPFLPEIIVDYNDSYVTGMEAGNEVSGASKLVYRMGTYTARGRTRIPGQTGNAVDPRGYHEGASDARAVAFTGPVPSY